MPPPLNLSLHFNCKRNGWKAHVMSISITWILITLVLITNHEILPKREVGEKKQTGNGKAFCVTRNQNSLLLNRIIKKRNSINAPIL